MRKRKGSLEVGAGNEDLERLFNDPSGGGEI